ncbi:HAD hydrolase-like protein [Stenotrophomonas maltophilia]|uniref:HAD hydrolase-like protein n=1 Tax=Stenotrophomonas maltophilia TaxID=40324 RepID=UPI00066D6487|nr:HAD hydrolase-like protein [Stenotrophomonas maltophilia]
MIRLCLFDLDQTLVDTEDMKEIREEGKHRTDAAYADEVRAAVNSRDRHLIDEATLLSMLTDTPDLKLGIFTRSPKRYVDAVLAEAYAQIQWDTVIAYEDVKEYKPNGEGVHRAMCAVGMGNSSELPYVLLVGDSDVDIRAAYNAGCRAALFRKGWPHKYEGTHWRSLSLMPDAVVVDQEELRTLLHQPMATLPDLEHALDTGMQHLGAPRFDELGKFFPGEKARHVIHAGGRYFPFYETLKYRREWHLLSSSIQAHKEATVFPSAWIETIQRYISYEFRYLAGLPIFFGDEPELIVTVVPARPGRAHRLGDLLLQLQKAYGDTPKVQRLRLIFAPDVLAYRDGVQSQSNDHLSQSERFANVRDHLYVVEPSKIPGKRYLIIDDVSTTGATLLYAKKYLTGAQASSVNCLSLAQTISDPLRFQ